MKKLLLLFFCFFLLNVQAEENSTFFSIDVGESKYGIKIYRLGIQKEFTDWFKFKDISLSGYFETSINYWEGNESEIYGIAFSPVFVIPFCDGCKYTPYIEAGVGVSYISKIMIDDSNMSSRFQFEDRIGFGIKTDNIDYHIRYMHYSNAGLVEPNQGVDIFLAGVAFKF